MGCHVLRGGVYFDGPKQDRHQPTPEDDGVMRTVCHRITMIAMIAVLVGLQVVLPRPALADIGDISVGGVWVCRLTRGAAGLTLEQRVEQINQRIVDVLSLPELTRRQIAVEVRAVGDGAAIVAADITVMTVTPADAAGTGVPVHEVANQWTARLVQGLRNALPGREVIARMYAPRPATRPEESQRLVEITWYWQGTWMGDGSQVTPDDPGRYTVQFSRDGRVAVRADCNRGAGTYDRRGQSLTVSVQALTKAACRPGSLERRYLAQLNAVDRVSWPGDILVLGLKDDSGAMRFSAVLTEARVTGTVTHRQRSALPTDAIVRVQLLDASKTDAPAIVLGQQTIATRDRQAPFAFEIRYDPRNVTASTVVVVRATITVGDRLLFTTTTAQRVVTGGYPSEGIEVVVQLVR
jgi:uncharacterized lipoprotein YbaY/heat shock protein HslJ